MDEDRKGPERGTHSADFIWEPAAVVARRLALEHLEAAEQAMGRMHEESDAEGLHDLRVAVRRLRTVARAFRSELRGSLGRRMVRRLRALQRRTSFPRDAEVGAAWLKRESPHLDPETRVLADVIRETFETSLAAFGLMLNLKFEVDALSRRLRKRLAQVHVTFPLEGRPDSYAEALTRRLHAEREAWQEAVRNIPRSGDPPLIHAARIRTKRLRYLVEPLQAPLREAREAVRHLRRLQNRLGAIHDRQVLDAFLEGMREEEARASSNDHGRRAAPGKGQGAPSSFTLTPIQDRLRQEVAGRMARLLRSGTASRSIPDLDASLDALLEALGALRSPARVEIERKYLLGSLPDLPPGTVTAEIEQGYLPGTPVVERLRRIWRPGEPPRHLRTLKFGDGLMRREIETEISPALFDALWPLSAGHRVRKRRHAVREGGVCWEVDEFLDRELVLAEVELALPEQQAPPPPWLAPHVLEEVTGQRRYTNECLAG